MGKLRVWHMPQIGSKDCLGNPIVFYVPVSSKEEAMSVLNMLADYDEFQAFNNIKPDYSNVNGLEEDVNGEWEEWFCSESGDDISEFIRVESEQQEIDSE